MTTSHPGQVVVAWSNLEVERQAGVREGLTPAPLEVWRFLRHNHRYALIVESCAGLDRAVRTRQVAYLGTGMDIGWALHH